MDRGESPREVMGFSGRGGALSYTVILHRNEELPPTGVGLCEVFQSGGLCIIPDSGGFPNGIMCHHRSPGGLSSRIEIVPIRQPCNNYQGFQGGFSARTITWNIRH